MVNCYLDFLGGLMVDKTRGFWEMLIDCMISAASRVNQTVQDTLYQNRMVKKAVTAAVCLMACGLLIMGFAVPKHVTVVVDDSLAVTETEYETTAKRVDSFLENHGIAFNWNRDLIDAEYYDAITDDMVIHITREFSVQLTADGKTAELVLLPTTVEEVLDQQGILLDSDDIVEPALDTQLKEGDHIVVKRVMKVLEKEEDITDYKTIYQADSSITIGDVQVTQKGRTGKVEKTYKVTYVDGEPTEKELVSKKTLKKKKDKIISYGTKIDFSKPAGLKYEKKYDHVRAVSYYFSGSRKGSYGLPCEFGTVAVDEELIPLGSLLYIEGYGYAVANDVGTSVKGKTVDLYMEKYEQCLLWGARWTTVYVIDEA